MYFMISNHKLTRSLWESTREVTKLRKDQEQWQFQFWTNLSNYAVFTAFSAYLKTRTPNGTGILCYWRGEFTKVSSGESFKGPTRKLILEYELFLVLIKLKTGKFNEDFAHTSDLCGLLVVLNPLNFTLNDHFCRIDSQLPVLNGSLETINHIVYMHAGFRTLFINQRNITVPILRYNISLSLSLSLSPLEVKPSLCRELTMWWCLTR